MPLSLHLTNHAQRAMAARHVKFSEVLDTVLNYQTRRESSVHRGVPTPKTYLYRKGNLTVVVSCESPERFVVKTVLLATTDQWSDEDARNRARHPSASGAHDQG